MAAEGFRYSTGCNGLAYNIDIDRLKALSEFLRSDEKTLEMISRLPACAIVVCQLLIEESYDKLNYQYCDDMERVFKLCEFYRDKATSVSRVEPLEKYADLNAGAARKQAKSIHRDQNGVIHREYWPMEKMMIGDFKVDE
jgi:hypothetical protein